jgi:hypothetical protein
MPAPRSASSLAGRTIVMSGGSRGIGLAILVAAAERGAKAVLLAKTETPDPRLPGTVHSAVEEIEAAGGRARAVVGDVRNEADVRRAVDVAVEEFGGIDVCVNNASAISQVGTADLPMKRPDRPRRRRAGRPDHRHGSGLLRRCRRQRRRRPLPLSRRRHPRGSRRPTLAAAVRLAQAGHRRHQRSRGGHRRDAAPCCRYPTCRTSSRGGTTSRSARRPERLRR